jgi:GNAT superfamily N-acetyltransferase
MSPLRIDYLDDHRDAIPTLARWHDDEWGAITPNLTMDDRARRFQSWAQRGTIPTAFVALAGHEVVGIAGLIVNDMETRPELSPWLGGVLVAPNHRGEGIGTALCERATQEACSLSVRRLYLLTFDKERFYSRLGWSELERTEFLGRPVTIMVRDLTA